MGRVLVVWRVWAVMRKIRECNVKILVDLAYTHMRAMEFLLDLATVFGLTLHVVENLVL